MDNKLNLQRDNDDDEIDLVCESVKEFTKLHYEYLNKQRNMVSSLYMDNAILSWDKIFTSGKDNIHQFWLKMPPSKHAIHIWDASRINSEADMFLVKVGGQMQYNKGFNLTISQILIIMAIDNKWKITSFSK